MIASLLRFNLLDTLVGLAVAILILKSAVELGIETMRSLREGDADLSRYRMGLIEWYARFRQAQLRDWMLYLVEKEEVLTQAELRARACEASVEKLRGFEIHTAYPGHGKPFPMDSFLINHRGSNEEA